MFGTYTLVALHDTVAKAHDVCFMVGFSDGLLRH